jgi:hypothetical protein
MLVMKNILYILIILAVLFAVFNFYRKNTFKDSAGAVCTMDVKMCPDGSYVGRVGSDCHFPECPVKK